MKKMKKTFLILIPILVCFLNTLTFAQQPAVKAKPSEKIKQKTQKLNENTAKTMEDAKDVASNANTSVNNAKTIVKLFEPFWVQIKGSASASGSIDMGTGTNNSTSVQDAQTPSSNTDNATSPTDNQTTNTPTDTQTSSGTTVSDAATSTDMQTPNASTPSTNSTGSVPSSSYNNDGTANWGCQDHPKYGCYLDAQQGLIMDEVDASTQTGAIDIIFTACKYGTGNIYTLMSPNYAKTSTRSRLLFRGEKYKGDGYPAKQWQVANASEIGVTGLTSDQFEKIKNSNQLTAVVNQVGTFKESFESAAKLEGKVFAVKTQIENRTSFALIYVVSQFGTSGSSSYLKVKLKVSGVDANGDGLPD
jgi:hypothetical protein